MIHDQNQVSEVAYLKYTELTIEQKTAEEQARHAETVKALIARYEPIHFDHIETMLAQEMKANVKHVSNPIDLNRESNLIEEKLTLSVSIINPTLTDEDISNLS